MKSRRGDDRNHDGHHHDGERDGDHHVGHGADDRDDHAIHERDRDRDDHVHERNRDRDHDRDRDRDDLQHGGGRPAISNGTTTTCSGNTCCGKSSLPAALGDAELTCYTFAQGPQSNTTFCGYRESETAYSDSDAGGACVTGGLAYNDTVANVGTNPGYFVAFPSNDLGWGQGAYCGMCVDVTYGGRTLMATVVDQCTTCGNSPDHIALSANLARDLGVGVGSVSGDVLGATWTTVACPVAHSNNGNIVVAWDSTGRASFQNVTYPVASVAGTLQTGGAWIVDAGASVTLTDLVGHQITAVMPTTDGGSLGTQFPASCP